MTRSVAVYQPRYYPRLHYFARASDVDAFVFYDDVEFSRRSRQHRAPIDFHGKQWLTVPVKRTGVETRIDEAKVDVESRWVEKHLGTLQHKYGRRARDRFEAYYPSEGREEVGLVDVTVPILEDLFGELDVGAERFRSSEVEYDGDRSASESLADLVSAVGGDVYVTGRTGYENYLDEAVFAERGIDVVVQDWTPEWEEGNAIVLDALFESDEPAQYVQSSSAHG